MSRTRWTSDTLLHAGFTRAQSPRTTVILPFRKGPRAQIPARDFGPHRVRRPGDGRRHRVQDRVRQDRLRLPLHRRLRRRAVLGDSVRCVHRRARSRRVLGRSPPLPAVGVRHGSSAMCGGVRRRRVRLRLHVGLRRGQMLAASRRDLRGCERSRHLRDVTDAGQRGGRGEHSFHAARHARHAISPGCRAGVQTARCDLRAAVDAIAMAFDVLLRRV